MATSLADSPPAPAEEHQPAAPGAGAPSQPQSPPPAAPGATPCARCGAPLAPGQDWCLQCGAGAPGSLGATGWRSAATILGVVAVLVLGAAAAAYAALSKSTHPPRTVTATVAQVTPPVTPTPPVPPVTSPVPPVATTPIAPTVKPPKIPLTAVTPQPTTTTPANTPSTPAKTTPTTPANTTPGETGSGEAQPTALLLDTNAASTYNPYNLPATSFGDPSLAIDGDPTTAWTAQVEPAEAPTMAEGLIVNLKGAQKLEALKLITSTPGMTVQVYGTKATTAPTSITDPAWIRLSHAQVVGKRHLRIKLKDAKKSFQFITLWISKAPASAVGTAQAPGHVSVNELELFQTGG